MACAYPQRNYINNYTALNINIPVKSQHCEERIEGQLITHMSQTPTMRAVMSEEDIVFRCCDENLAYFYCWCAKFFTVDFYLIWIVICKSILYMVIKTLTIPLDFISRKKKLYSWQIKTWNVSRIIHSDFIKVLKSWKVFSRKKYYSNFIYFGIHFWVLYT